MSARRDPGASGRGKSGGDRPRFRRQGGMTLIELMVASFIALVFTLAAGTAYLVNQNAYRRNTQKLALQQMVSQAVEIMERGIRSGARATFTTQPQITLFDRTGAQIAQFSKQPFGSTSRLYQGSSLMAPQDLINLRFTPNADTSVVTIFLELQDDSKNRVGLQASATLRNHLKFAHLGP